MARDKKELAEQKKLLKQKMAGKREMSKKHKAGNADEDAMTGNADEDVMALASSHSREEIEKMLADAKEAFGGMVEDDSSHSGEADSSDGDI